MPFKRASSTKVAAWYLGFLPLCSCFVWGSFFPDVGTGGSDLKLGISKLEVVPMREEMG
jgi:hypothetical protein